jgi:hypothetical protein
MKSEKRKAPFPRHEKTVPKLVPSQRCWIEYPVTVAILLNPNRTGSASRGAANYG